MLRATAIVLLWATVASGAGLFRYLGEEIEAAVSSYAYFYNMETATFPEPLTDRLIQTITAKPSFRFTNGQNIIEKVSHQLAEFIQHIPTLGQLQRDEHKIRKFKKTLKQYNRLPGFSYYYKMETATFPEPLTDRLIQIISARPGFRFRNGQDLTGKVTSQLSGFIQHIHTLDQLQRDEPKIRKALEQYKRLPGFQEDLDMIEMCLKTRPMQIQAGLDGNISAMLEHMMNNEYGTLDTQKDPTAFHAYLRDKEARVNGLCNGDAKLFLDLHRNMGFVECWEEARLQFRKQGSP